MNMLRGLIKSPLFRERFIFLALLAMIWLTFSILFYNPIRKAVSASDARVDTLQQEVATNKALIDDVVSYANQLDKIKQDYEELKKGYYLSREIIPLKSELTDIIREITSSGLNVKVVSITPSEKIEKDAYILQPYNLKIQSDFPSLGAYISKMESSRRFIEIESLSMESRDPGGLFANLKINIYLLSGV